MDVMNADEGCGDRRIVLSPDEGMLSGDQHGCLLLLLALLSLSATYFTLYLYSVHDSPFAQ